MLGGLKERLSDKIDPLTAFINEKIEDFITNEKVSDLPNKLIDEDGGNGVKDGQLSRHDRLEFENITTSVDSIQNSAHSSELLYEMLNRNQANSPPNTQPNITSNTTPNSTPNTPTYNSRSNCFEINEDFIEGETQDTLSNISKHKTTTPHISKSLSADDILKHSIIDSSLTALSGENKVRMKNLIHRKSENVSSVSSISMSGLLSNQKVSTANLLDKGEAMEVIPSPSTEEPSVPMPVLPPTITPGRLSSLPWLKVCLVVAAMLSYFMPLSSFIYGVLFGLVCSLCVFSVYLWILRPPTPVELFAVPDMNNTAPLLVPNMNNTSHADGSFKVSNSSNRHTLKTKCF